MKKSKKINILALAKFQAVLLAPIGLVTGIIYSFGGTIYDIVQTGTVNYGTALAYVALIVQPLMFAVAGYILGIIEAVIFNQLVNRFVNLNLNME